MPIHIYKKLIKTYMIKIKNIKILTNKTKKYMEYTVIIIYKMCTNIYYN